MATPFLFRTLHDGVYKSFALVDEVVAGLRTTTMLVELPGSSKGSISSIPPEWQLVAFDRKPRDRPFSGDREDHLRPAKLRVGDSL